MKKLIRYWFPVVLWMIVIFLFSGRQKVALTDSYAISFLVFKTLHLLEYAILYILLYRAARYTSGYKNHAFFWTIVMLTLYAVTDEIHQSFVPTREGRLRDVIIDGIGGGIGWILIAYLLPKAPKKLKILAKNWQLL